MIRSYQRVLQGIYSGLAKGQEAAEDIASLALGDELSATDPATAGPEGLAGLNAEAPAATVNLAESLVDLKVAEHQVKASTQIIRTADEVMGTLVDIKG